MVDSEDSDCEGQEGSGCILPDQIVWYQQLSQSYQNKWNKIIPALAFFHIPLQEYMFMWNDETCYGYNNDTVSCQALDTGFFAAAKEQQDIQGMFVGHNHGNDFCGIYDGIQLCFGR
jgi:hypothetical protein